MEHDKRDLARVKLEKQAWEDRDGGRGNIENIGGGERDLSKAADGVGQVETKIASVSVEVPQTKERYQAAMVMDSGLLFRCYIFVPDDLAAPGRLSILRGVPTQIIGNPP